uniref:RxLR effector protein n=1 Tax=Phytophthora ramorum TaxID=164328 RepID=H3GWD2_PHYRM
MNLRNWLKEGQSADNVANLLNLDDKVDSVLSNPNFNALAKYISKFNKRNPEKKVSMIEVLTNRYGEPAVSKMLVAAKNVESRKVWATKLQGDQVAGWINSEKTAVDVFKILKLNDAATLPLKTRNLEAWKNYVTILTKRKLGPATTMFETFRNVYKDDGLAKLIETSKMQVGVGPVAMDLKTSLFTSWKTEKITKSTISTKIFGLKNGDDGDKVTKLIIAQYKEYLKTGSLYLVKGTR